MATEQERQVAAWVSTYVERMYEFAPGLPVERDDKDGSGLTIDFTFDATDHPFAVEVARLRDDFEFPSDAEIEKLWKRLARFAERKGSPNWNVGLRAQTSLTDQLGPAIERIIEWMLAAKLDKLAPAFAPADLSKDTAARLYSDPELKHEFLYDCRAASLEGVVLVRRTDARGVTIQPIVEFADSKSLSRSLARSMGRKEEALACAKRMGYWTMLAIDVKREDTYGYLADGTRLPRFSKNLGYLWLFVRDPDGDLAAAFVARHSPRRRHPRLAALAVVRDGP